jgi:single-strand DNA-binding protein
MRGFSKAIITGNLTRDPELRSTPNGASVCSFSVAVNRTYRDASGEQREDVSFIDCSAWGKLGEMISQYAKKGTGVLVSGRLDQRSWEDKTTGQKRSRVEIVVEDFNFTGAARDNGNNTGNFGAANTVDNTPSDIPDDIPDGEIDLSDVPF